MTTTEGTQVKPEKEKYVCHECIDDEVLAEEVKKAGTQAECNYCSSQVAAMDLPALSGRIHQVIEEQFEPKPIFLQTPSDERTDGFLSYCRENFCDTQTIITKVAKLAPRIANDVREFLFSLFAEDADTSVAGYNPYDQHMLYEEREGDSTEFRLRWWEFRDEIHHRARFFGKAAAATLDEIFADLNSRSYWLGGSVIREISPKGSDSYFWRGRVAYSLGEAKRIVDAPSKEMGPSPNRQGQGGPNELRRDPCLLRSVR